VYKSYYDALVLLRHDLVSLQRETYQNFICHSLALVLRLIMHEIQLPALLIQRDVTVMKLSLKDYLPVRVLIKARASHRGF